MINLYNAKRFCKEDISKIENYGKAIADQTQTWCCHHRLGLTRSREELKRLDMYYNRPACELIFLTESEHSSLHNTGKTGYWAGKTGTMKGKTHSAETRAKISAANKGKTPSDEARRKMSESHKGMPLSEKTKRKMSKAKKGKKRKPFSEEHRRKMSEAQKARWAKRKEQS